MPGRVSDYLRRVRESSAPELDSLLRSLDGDRRRFEHEVEARGPQVSEALGYLARKRLLASNTLRRSNPTERNGWDEANRWISELIQQDPAPSHSTGDLRRLNAILLGREGASATRDCPIFSCNDAYLEPTEVGGELDALEAWTQDERHPALIAAVVYIAVVTIHPFENGNGRTARLAADRVLLQNDHLTLCFLSPVSSHVAQMQSGPTRDPDASIRMVLAAVAESYATVLRRIATHRAMPRPDGPW
jgi:hypothetical protein